MTTGDGAVNQHCPKRTKPILLHLHRQIQTRTHAQIADINTLKNAGTHACLHAHVHTQQYCLAASLIPEWI